MVTVTSRAVIPAPVEKPAAFVPDLSHDRGWRSEVISMELDPPGPARIGQRIKDRIRSGPLKLTIPAEVVEVGATSLTIHARGPLGMTMRIHREVSPHPEGSVVTYHVVFEEHGFSRLLATLMAPAARRTLNANVARIPAAMAALRP